MQLKHFVYLAMPLVAGSFSVCCGARADIVFGLAGPLSGGNAVVGAQMRAGMEAAIQYVNDHGGLLQQKLSLSVADDACDGRQAIAVAQRFSAAGVRFVFGDYCSIATLPASSIYADVGTLEITISTDPKITDQGFDGIFRLVGRDDQQGDILASYLATRFAGKRVGILADRSTYGISLADAVRSGLSRRGTSTVAFDQSISSGTRDFKTTIDALKQANLDVVVFAGYAAEAGFLAKQGASAGLRAPFVGGGALANHLFWDIAGPSAEGTVFTFPAEVSTAPAARDAVEQLAARQESSEGYTLYGYAAVQLYASAIERAHSLDPEAVDTELHKGEFQTALGLLSFDGNGDNLAPNLRLYQWVDGKLKYKN